MKNQRGKPLTQYKDEVLGLIGTIKRTEFEDEFIDELVNEKLIKIKKKKNLTKRK